MRPNCPLCGSTRRLDDWVMEFKVPDGWPNPTSNRVCLCLDCGMIYYDNDMTQEDYDEYYRNYYGYDGNEHSENNLNRLNDLAELAAKQVPFDATIVDFGGGDGYLASRLAGMGFTRTSTVEVADDLPNDIDLLISAQTFEHLYDLRPILEKLISHLSYKGQFLIEIPDGYMMPYIDPPMPIMDYHQKHVNHFIPAVLDKLFEQYGYTRCYTHSGSTPCYFGHHYRVVYRKHLPEVIYTLCKMKVHDRIENKIAKMRNIHGPVIVWGCGDLCLHMLTKIKLNVLFYVDNDPAFEGAVIDGIPVYSYVPKIAENFPIVIIAQNQASGILKRIKELGLSNEVIVI